MVQSDAMPRTAPHGAKQRDLITTAQAAALLGKSRWTVARLVDRGELVPAMETSLGFMFDADDIEAARAKAGAR